MIHFFLATVTVVCVVLAYRLGKRDGERKALTIAVSPAPLHVGIDSRLIAAVLAAEGWTVLRTEAHEPPKPKPH